MSRLSKYNPLWNYLKENQQEQYVLSFDEIKNILDFEIDHSFLSYKKEAENYGYVVGKISLKGKTIIFDKMRRNEG